MQFSTYQDLIKDEFEVRKSFNSSYSLRAYARDLSLSAPQLSLILNHKKGISVETAKRIASKLKLSPEKRDWFCSSAGSIHARSFKERKKYSEIVERHKKASQVFTNIQLKFFEVISDWYHFAILELTYLDDFKNDIPWIASKLKISESEVQNAIDRMLELGLLKKEKGTLIDNFKFLATPSDTPSNALKKYNSQLLNKALVALAEQNVERREIAANIIAIDKSKIHDIKEEIREFRRKLEHKVSKYKNKDAVYCLSTQFFDLTKLSEEIK